MITWRRHARAAGLLSALAALWLLAFPYFERTRNANELPRLIQGAALVESGSLALDWSVRESLDVGPDVSLDPRTGRLYPNKPPGPAPLLAPAYAVGRLVWGDELTLRRYTWLARFVLGLMPTLLLCGVAARRWTPSLGAWPVFAGLWVYALGTPAAAYSHLAYGHQLAACLLLVGLAELLDGYEGGSFGRAWFGGLLLAYGVTVDYLVAFAGVPIAVACLLRLRGARGPSVTSVAAGGAALPLAALLYYHYDAFGSALTTGYHTVLVEDFARKHSQGLLGLGAPSWQGFERHVLDPGGGLLWWAPVLPLALVGLVSLLRRPGALRTEAGIHLALLVGYIVLSAGLVFEGGWRVGPRYLVAVLPAVGLGTAAALARLRERPRLLALAIVPMVAGIVVNVAAATLWPHFDLTAVRQPVPEVLWPLAREGHEPWGLVHELGLGGALWWGLAGALGGLWWALARGAGPGRGVSLAPGFVAGVGLVGIVGLVEPHPRSAANLAYVRRVWEPPRDGGPEPRSWTLPRPAPSPAAPPPVSPPPVPAQNDEGALKPGPLSVDGDL